MYAGLNSEILERMVYGAFRRAYEEDRGGARPQPNTIYVTEVSCCIRKSWYIRALNEPLSPETVVIMVLGDAVHYIMRDMLSLGESEKRFEKQVGDFKIAGRVDKILGNIVVEFKTTSQIPQKPYEHHIDQLQLYLWLSDLNIGYLVYVDKRRGKVKAFKVTRNDERIKRLLLKAKKLYSSLKTGMPPEPDPKPWECEYCQFKELCEYYKGKDKNKLRKDKTHGTT